MFCYLSIYYVNIICLCYIVVFIYIINRNYNHQKITNNIQCEIFQTILEEARESYQDNIIHELISNVPEDLERNVDIITQCIEEWCINK